MAANLSGSPTQAAHDEPMFHNPVLTRTREPARAHSSPWMVVIPAVLAVIAAIAAWVYVDTHPAPPVVNHAVGAMPSTPG